MRFSLWVFLWASAASATTLVALDLPALTRSSDAVVHGKVIKVESRWAGDHKRIVTDVEIEVADQVKGPAAKTVHLINPGGAVGDVGQLVHGTPTFEPSEEVVVFLERRPNDTFLVTGMSQGKFRVERSTDGRAAFAVPQGEPDAMLIDPSTRQKTSPRTQTMKLDELKARVRQLSLPAPTDEPTTPPGPGKPGELGEKVR